MSTVVESVFPVSLPPPAEPGGWQGRAWPGRAGPGRARPGRTGPYRTSPCGRAGPGRAGPGRAGSGRAGPGPALPRRAGPLPAPGRASERDRQQGFGAHDRAGLRHATGGRASERDQASAHTTGPGFGTPLAQLIPRRQIGLCRFPRYLQLSPCQGHQMHRHLI